MNDYVPNVEGRVRQDGVHEGQPEDGEHRVDDRHHHEVPVVRVALLQSVLRTESVTNKIY